MISVQVRDEKIRLRTPRSSPSFPQEIRLSQWGCDIVLLLLYGSAFTEGSRPVKKKKRRVKIGGAMQPEPLIREDREMVRHVAWKKERLVYEKSAIIVVKPDESKYPPELRLLTADEALSWTIMGCCKHPVRMRRHQRPCTQYLYACLHSCLIIIISLSCVVCLVRDALPDVRSSVLSPCPDDFWFSLPRSLCPLPSALWSPPCTLSFLHLNFGLCHCGSLCSLLFPIYPSYTEV